MITDLKVQRNSLRLSQSGLARLSGVSRYRICLHELGDLVLSTEELQRIERAVDLEVRRFQGMLADATRLPSDGVPQSV